MAWVDQLAESGVLYPLWHREGFLSVGRAKNACRQVIRWDRWRRSKIRGRQVGLFRPGTLTSRQDRPESASPRSS